MYSFSVVADTLPTERVALIGGATAVGGWNVAQALQLARAAEEEPGRWIAAVDLSDLGNRRFEYKYIKVSEDGEICWEEVQPNRSVLVVAGCTFHVDDGEFGKAPPAAAAAGTRGPPLPAPQGEGAKRVLICGSSVAAGSHAADDHGWAWLLARVLGEQYGHQTVNVAVHGNSTVDLLRDFMHLVAPYNADVVVIALSLANEGLSWQPEEKWSDVCASFKDGIQKLVSRVREAGALPILGGLYPNGDYHSAKQYELLKEVHDFTLSLGVPVIDWLGRLDDGQGKWADGLMHDPGHPNTAGHQRMLEAIDLALFEPGRLQGDAA